MVLQFRRIQKHRPAHRTPDQFGSESGRMWRLLSAWRWRSLSHSGRTRAKFGQKSI